MNEITEIEFQSKCNQIIPNKFIFQFNSKETLEINNQNYEHKVKNFQTTRDKLLIVSDFDFTLTRNFIENERLLSAINVVINSNFISKEFKIISGQLHEKYAKYEYDTTIDLITKDQMMHLWFKENFDLISKQKISQQDFMEMLLEGQNKFFYRSGILEIFESIEKYKIPFFIVSAGVYEIIENSLKLILSGPKYEKLKEEKLINIIANRFKYDENDYIKGYEEPIVYTFNKGEVLKKVFLEFGIEDVNIVLMGDHINDIDSIKYIEYRDVIKFGFINFFKDSVDEKKKELVEIYKKKFDVLVFGDGNLNSINNLIGKIFEEEDF